MPGNMLSPSLAESWTVSPDQLVYEFKLREGLKFHNGDAFTADDVKFSFYRAKGSKVLRDKVKEVVVVDPARVRFVLHEPWPDFITFYGTILSGAGWIVPKAYVERVGDDGFKKAPVGLGPYKFVSYAPGMELVMEANEGYWRKTPSVKRLVFKTVPESTTRLAMLKRGEVDIAYLLEGPQAQEVKRDPNLKLAFSGGIAIFYLDFLDQWDPKSPWADQRVRLAANYAIDRQALSEAETLGASKPDGQHVPQTFEFALPLEPYPYDPAKAKQLLAEAGYPERVRRRRASPASALLLAGRGDRRLSPGGRHPAQDAHDGARRLHGAIPSKKARASACAPRRSTATRLRACPRSSPATASWATAAIPTSTRSSSSRPRRRTAASARRCCTRSSGCVHERVRFGPIYEYIWPSGIGPRVAEPALMLIDPYPWSAPLEEVRLKSP